MYLTFIMIGDRWAARHNISTPKPAPTTALRLPAPAPAATVRKGTGK